MVQEIKIIFEEDKTYVCGRTRKGYRKKRLYRVG